MRRGSPQPGSDPNLIARRRANLTDEDWRVHAIAQFGGVVRVLDQRRGVVVERFSTVDGEDCTHSIGRLSRAELVDWSKVRREISPDLLEIARNAFQKGTKP